LYWAWSARQAHAGIDDVHIAIGDKEVALPLLRAAGGNFRDAARKEWGDVLLAEAGIRTAKNARRRRGRQRLAAGRRLMDG